MKHATRNTWVAALLVLALGSGELIAYQGIAPHAKRLGEPGRVVLKAGRIVLRDLSALAVSRGQDLASYLALRGLHQTSNLYRLATRTLGVESPANAVPAFPDEFAADAAVRAEIASAAEPDATSDPKSACAEADAAVASESDATCDPSPVRFTKLECTGGGCPACPVLRGRVVEARVIRASSRARVSPRIALARI
jgi:hypothetical protein